ncbi:MAG: hypothetical protein HYU66_16500 [Armatimonadetes bacterium]|nr:hypothetical protein [Armatimonadota bacterium]
MDGDDGATEYRCKRPVQLIEVGLALALLAVAATALWTIAHTGGWAGLKHPKVVILLGYVVATLALLIRRVLLRRRVVRVGRLGMQLGKDGWVEWQGMASIVRVGLDSGLSYGLVDRAGRHRVAPAPTVSDGPDARSRVLPMLALVIAVVFFVAMAVLRGRNDSAPGLDPIARFMLIGAGLCTVLLFMLLQSGFAQSAQQWLENGDTLCSGTRGSEQRIRLADVASVALSCPLLGRQRALVRSMDGSRPVALDLAHAGSFGLLEQVTHRAGQAEVTVRGLDRFPPTTRRLIERLIDHRHEPPPTVEEGPA